MLSTSGVRIFLQFEFTFLPIEQIERDFKFFPHLHQIFASRPNVTPIVITTALGPQGRKTVWYQPLDGNDTAPPAAVSASQPAPPFTPAHGPSTPAHGPSMPAHDSSPSAYVPSH